ncbi:hypothetical protein Blut17040_08240 [Blautia luti]|uniref:Cyclic nucleotide-binding domain-containing protein n=1 Tax=Blautia luti DSM 14534 = JCM 17040 TaxID=649762 RepID=A0A844GK36_9FIRM|nr:Crp/Fnr family transcriptional regulator [Blautia luti]MTD62446.1 cyclic nucleotide-binding domain-containing protein [Blautia luti DSM 14534 = JCM 17040]BEI59795.1 hypothetical protein Blut17040_08240 [Blautia luti]
MTDNITLFSHILPEEQERMRVCFQAREILYKNNEIIMEYSDSMTKIGLILEGQATLYCCDIDGTEYIMDELHTGSVFGEPFLLPGDSLHYYVRSRSRTRVMFIDYQHVIKRCSNACSHHSQLISNLLQMTARKASQQTNRIYVLSHGTIRQKLMSYFSSLVDEKTHTAALSMSYTDLAQYLSVDRSAMMRELKNLCEEQIIAREGRIIHILS